MATTTPNDFGRILRHWRNARRLSQLDLALQADVSAKHVSFLETGRNRPSREMILRLATAMDVPLRDRNLMFNAAGFAAAYSENSLDAPTVSRVDEALSRILAQHEPFPAIVLDGDWTIIRQNRGAAALTRAFLGPDPPDSANAMEILFADNGLRPWVVNWDRLSAVLLMRLFREAMAQGGDGRNRWLFDRLVAMPATPPDWRDLASREPAGPILDMELARGDVRCRFFTTVTTFGTPQDVTLQELRIEAWFPGDEATRELCEAWGAQA